MCFPWDSYSVGVQEVPGVECLHAMFHLGNYSEIKIQALFCWMQ